jgi:hypothetical protein
MGWLWSRNLELALEDVRQGRHSFLELSLATPPELESLQVSGISGWNGAIGPWTEIHSMDVMTKDIMQSTLKIAVRETATTESRPVYSSRHTINADLEKITAS